MNTLAASQRLEGKTAIVTGGAGLLGPEFGRALAELGANVILADVSAERAKDAAVRLSTECGGHPRGMPVDVTDPFSVADMVRAVTEVEGSVDILVNAAVGRPQGFFDKFEDYTLSNWRAVLDVNLTGVFLCCQAVGRHMRERGRGCIINVSSIYGVAAPDQRIYVGTAINTPAAYSASKAGVLGLTRHLATYWAPQNIRVNAITPGGVFNNQEDAFVQKYADRTPLGRMAQPHELRGAVAYLATDASAYVTGQNLIVDGGWTVW